VPDQVSEHSAGHGATCCFTGRRPSCLVGGVQSLELSHEHNGCSPDGRDHQDSEGLQGIMGAAAILDADPEQRSNVLKSLENASSAGQDEWPQNVTEACNCLSKWEGDDKGNQQPCDHNGVAFGLDGNAGKASGPQPWCAKMTRKNGNKKGHIASFWEDKSPTQMSRMEKFTKGRRNSCLIPCFRMLGKIMRLACSHAKANCVRMKKTGVQPPR
jgi:hypothetical protein